MEICKSVQIKRLSQSWNGGGHTAESDLVAATTHLPGDAHALPVNGCSD